MVYSREIIERLDNWRRCFRITHKIHAVNFYTPPELGQIWDDERTVKVQIDLKDAIHLEMTWRTLSSQPKKYFLKYQYINLMQRQVIWRKLKVLGVRLKNDADFDAFNESALFYFENNLKR